MGEGECVSQTQKGEKGGPPLNWGGKARTAKESNEGGKSKRSQLNTKLSRSRLLTPGPAAAAKEGASGEAASPHLGTPLPPPRSVPAFSGLPRSSLMFLAPAPAPVS